MDTARGSYLGTEISEAWWKRYFKDGLFLRGNGEYWYDARGFYFRRYLTKTPIFISFNDILNIKSGTWHAGRWALGNLIVKMVWKKDHLTLSSGFIVSNRRQEALRLIEILKAKREEALQS